MREYLGAAQRLTAALEEARPARSFAPDSLEAQVAADSFLLTAKPMLYVANVDEDQIGKSSDKVRTVEEIARADGGRAIVLSGKVEAELAGLSESEAAEFRGSWASSAAASTIWPADTYELLGLMTFLTAGEKEARAWPIRKRDEGSPGGRHDPQRYRARLHPGRDRLVRRLRAVPDHGGVARRRARPQRGPGVRDARG